MSKSGSKESKYHRILLKLSGEALQSKDKRLGIDPDIVSGIAQQIKTVADMGVQIAMVIGGGNIFRGLSGQERGIARTSGDYMGMLATIINGLALQDAVERTGLESRLQTAIKMSEVAEPFILRRAMRHLEKGRILILAGGTGNPYFSTDTAAALRASEIGADVLLKATKVKGVYSSDPMVNPDAEYFHTLTYTKALKESLNVMDASAFSLCRENGVPIVVFNFFEQGNFERVVRGEPIGTVVSD